MKVILIEDELVLLRELQRMLKQVEGIEIEASFSNPLIALEKIESIDVDVIFLDIEMPAMNGIELAEKITQIKPEVKIVFATAYNHYASEAFEANAVDYLLKPIRVERLIKTLSKLQNTLVTEDNLRTKSVSVRIQSFGKFSIFVNEMPFKWQRAKQQELLAYLLSQQGLWIDKYRICDDLWSDFHPEQALANLQTAVWALRKTFRELQLSNFQIEYQTGCYMLAVQTVSWDKVEFESLISKVGNNKLLFEEQEELKKLYKGGFLLYDDWNWAMLEKRRYDRIYREVMNRK